MKTLWYRTVRFYIKIGLFFYTKKIITIGKEHIPKKGAVLFAINHPNGLLDPLMVTTNVSRDTYYLVRAAAFKSSFADKLLRSLNLRPIYRIRDGRQEMSKNESVFNDCFEILNNQKVLMIFPEGSHDQRRTVRMISKGFTRIVFGALDKYPDLKISVVPVGITYQNIGHYPSKVAIHFGTPIQANDIYNPKELNTSIDTLKEEVSKQLKKLSVHIPTDENYANTLEKLNKNNTDFTKVDKVNKTIQENNFTKYKKRFNLVKPFYFILILNSIIPWMIWKNIAKKIDEREFIDTFRAVFGAFLFPIFYLLQGFMLYYIYNVKIAMYYLAFTIITTLIYTKLSVTQTE